MVAVRMVSEGVDVPRLAVGVYATSASTPLYFAQAVGRFVRSRRPGETASVFVPSVPVLLGLASELEAQRDHVLGKPHRADEQWDDELLAAAQRQQDEPGEEEAAFTALGAQAELDQLIYEGTSFSADEEDYLGLPGLLAPDQVRTLLNQRQREWLSRSGAARRRRPRRTRRRPPRPSGPQLSVRERLAALRKELNTLVALHHHRTNKPHGKIHNELRARVRRAADRDGQHGAAGGAHRHPALLALTGGPAAGNDRGAGTGEGSRPAVGCGRPAAPARVNCPTGRRSPARAACPRAPARGGRRTAARHRTGRTARTFAAAPQRSQRSAAVNAGLVRVPGCIAVSLRRCPRWAPRAVWL